MMDKREMEQLLRTLNLIEVRGADNLDKLLACIKFIENKLKEMENG